MTPVACHRRAASASCAGRRAGRPRHSRRRRRWPTGRAGPRPPRRQSAPRPPRAASRRGWAGAGNTGTGDPRAAWPTLRSTLLKLGSWLSWSCRRPLRPRSGPRSARSSSPQRPLGCTAMCSPSPVLRTRFGDQYGIRSVIRNLSVRLSQGLVGHGCGGRAVGDDGRLSDRPVRPKKQESDLHFFPSRPGMPSAGDQHESALIHRRDELADVATDLRRQSRTYWKRPMAQVGLGAAGSLPELAGANRMPAELEGAAALLAWEPPDGLGRFPTYSRFSSPPVVVY